ncbi:hypothetical protein BDA96_04G312200 [Sorghum bicolor]|uniref:Uncharacterized protein n=1 Tax=Sorghum bicolor TaxID=4558 RepID=A0A921R7G6_SORBI|nr:hypothetical protein BDA96_04G312200 [Sorghum bicolor]
MWSSPYCGVREPLARRHWPWRASVRAGRTRPSTHVRVTLCFLRWLPSASLHPQSAPFASLAALTFFSVSPSCSLVATSSKLRGIAATRLQARSASLHHLCSLLLLPSRHCALHGPPLPLRPGSMHTTGDEDGGGGFNEIWPFSSYSFSSPSSPIWI